MNIENEAIDTMKAFVSGQMSAEDFWKEFKASETIRNILINDEEKWEKEKATESGSAWFSTTQSVYENVKNIKSYKDSERLHWIVRKYILRNQIPVNIDNFYSDRFDFLINIQPDWLDVENEEFLINEIINKIPGDIKTKSQKIRWCKDKIKEYFKYDKTPPRWIQNPEWPIVDGRPLVFKSQSREREDDEQVCFYFYDPDTKQETVVTQFY